jgi:hypothetical protein
LCRSTAGLCADIWVCLGPLRPRADRNSHQRLSVVPRALQRRDRSPSLLCQREIFQGCVADYWQMLHPPMEWSLTRLGPVLDRARRGSDYPLAAPLRRLLQRDPPRWVDTFLRASFRKKCVITVSSCLTGPRQAGSPTHEVKRRSSCWIRSSWSPARSYQAPKKKAFRADGHPLSKSARSPVPASLLSRALCPLCPNPLKAHQVLLLFSLAGPSVPGMTPEECLYSSNSSFANSFNTRDHPQSIISTGTPQILLAHGRSSSC